MNQMYGINYPEHTANRPKRFENKDFLLCWYGHVSGVLQKVPSDF